MNIDGQKIEDRIDKMKIAIMCNTKSSEFPNRPELIDALNQNGYKVYFAAINDGECNNYYSYGKAVLLPIIASRNNTNPFIELRSLLDVRKKIKSNKIDSTIIYGVKNHAAMALGAKLGGAKRILCVVNGRGNLFTVKGIKGKLLRLISCPMLKMAYLVSGSVCFQNEDDANYFVKKKLVKRKKVTLTNGSGVNISTFPFSRMPDNNDFLYLARITPSKGLYEYIEASKIVRKKYPECRFHVVGPIDDTIEESCENLVNIAAKEGIIQYHGKSDNVKDWIEKTSYFVYPSYYPEGVPRCILQAMSCGRPIITCNSSGCKKTVKEGINGYLTRPRDYIDVADKMEKLVRNRMKAEKMGKESRKIVENSFDVNIVNKKIISILNNI